MFLKPRVSIDHHPNFVAFSDVLFTDVVVRLLERILRGKIMAMSEAFDMNNAFIIEQREILLLCNRAFGYDDEHALITPFTELAAKAGVHCATASSSHGR